jgi:hypothetical protein
MKIIVPILGLLLSVFPAAAQDRAPAFAVAEDTRLLIQPGDAVQRLSYGRVDGSPHFRGTFHHDAAPAAAGAPDRWSSARRGAKIGGAVGAVAGVVGFAMILRKTDEEVDRSRTPCPPGGACGDRGGMNVARAFLPVAYLIFAAVGAASGALVGAGVGAVTGT